MAINDKQRTVNPLARAVHWSLLIGLLLSAALMCIGLVTSLVRNQHAPDAPPPPMLELLQQAMHGNWPDVLNIAIVLSLFTPVARVLVLAVGWGLRREGRMALVALTVLVLLTVSLFLSAG